MRFLINLVFSLILLSCYIEDHAQPDLIPSETTLDSCQSGPPHYVLQNWDIYHSVNDQWNGDKDTNFCFQVVDQWGYVNIGPDDYDFNRPIFLRYTGDSIPLIEDKVYAVWGQIPDQSLDLENLEFCNDDFCQGMRVGIEIPAAADDSTSSFGKRWHQGPFLEDFFPMNGLIPFGNQFLCFPTEKFQEGNYLTDIILKLIPQVDQSINIYLSLTYDEYFVSDYTLPGDAEPWFLQIDDLEYQAFVNSSFNEGVQAALILHTDSGYPSSENPSYYDLNPPNNPDTVADIDLILEEGIALIAQPWAFLRAGLVQGSDSVRHNLNIINQGSDICFVGGYEVIINGQESYIHKAGQLNFLGVDACMQFRPESKLQIEENAELIYGSTTAGILYLFNDMDVVIQKFGTLEIGNTVFLNHQQGQGRDHIDLELGPFSSLIFREGSKVRNWSPGAIAKLHIHMKGGYLDISNLDDESLSNIVIHYPEEKNENDIRFLNPTSSEFLEFGWLVEVDGPWQATIYTIEGKLVDRFNIRGQFPGLTYERRSISELNSGVYILLLQNQEKTLSGQFIRD